MTRKFANNPQAILNGAIATAPAAGTVESWPVTVQAALAPGGGWPTLNAGDDMVCLVDSELIRVTAGTMTTGNHNWTVERGWEGTPTAVHANAAPVRLELTADSLAAIQAGYLATGTSDQAKVSLAAGLTATDNVAKRVDWDTEDWDTNGMHSTVTNPSRITIQSAGRYRVMAVIEWAASAVGVRLFLIYINGAQQEVTQINATSAGVTSIPVFFEGNFAAGDYIELYGYQNSGGNLGIDGAGTTWMSVKRIDTAPGFPALVGAWESSGQSIPDVTDTAVNWTAQDAGLATNWGSPANVSRLLITANGLYRIAPLIAWTAVAATFTTFVKIFKNGALLQQIQASMEDVTNGLVSGRPLFANLVAGDYLEVMVRHNHGSAETIDAAQVTLERLA